MSRQKLSRNAPCPCGSGKKYKHCCSGKGFDSEVDEAGTIYRTVPIADELAGVLEEQRREFVAKFGREPGPGDRVFFNTPEDPKEFEKWMVDNLQQAGFPPAMIYAYQKTGLLVLDNRHLVSDKDLAEWDAAIEEYKAMHPEGEGGQLELF